MEKELRIDIDRIGDLDANTPRSIDLYGSPRSFLDDSDNSDNDDNDDPTNEKNTTTGSVLDRLMDGEKNELLEKQRIKDEILLQQQAAQTKLLNMNQKEKDDLERPARLLLQKFIRGATVRLKIRNSKNEILRLILANCIVDIVEELEWLHEKGHGNVFFTIDGKYNTKAKWRACIAYRESTVVIVIVIF